MPSNFPELAILSVQYIRHPTYVEKLIIIIILNIVIQYSQFAGKFL